MLSAPIPSDEAQRHLNLLSYNILDSEDEQDYNDLIELAANVCNCPVALVSFVDTNRQWFKAKINLIETEKKRDTSFCGHVILGDEVMIIHDAAKDKRFADNPDVIGGLNIQFYAGAPIVSPEGYNLGSVCVIDNVPRPDFDESQKKALKIISAQVSKLIELRLKNKIVKEQAAILLKEEKNNARINTVLREKENDHTAYQLHENIAQILAVAKMKIETMELEESFSKEIIDQSKNYLALAINDIKQLSRSITPTTFKSADYTYYIKKLIEDHNSGDEAKIVFSKDGESLKLSATLGLTIYRMIQYMIEYAALAGASKIILKLSSTTNTLLFFQHNGYDKIAATEEGIRLLNNINTRADIINAVYKNDATGRTIQILLPDV